MERERREREWEREWEIGRGREDRTQRGKGGVPTIARERCPTVARPARDGLRHATLDAVAAVTSVHEDIAATRKVKARTAAPTTMHREGLFRTSGCCEAADTVAAARAVPATRFRQLAKRRVERRCAVRCRVRTSRSASRRGRPTASN